MNDEKPEIRQLLTPPQERSKTALDDLVPLVYDELKKLAARQLAAERLEHTLQPTALVNEVYLLLVKQYSVDWENRLHFFSIAAQAMRRILVNHAIKRNAQKRGLGKTLLALDEALDFSGRANIDFLKLEEALDDLAKMDERQAKIVELRFFGGLTNEEIAEFMKISISTIKREWSSARAWLLTQIA